jgi:hypothetical protein
MKRAICVGLNYPGSQYQLGGCVNDANMIAARIAAKGGEVKVVENYLTASEFLDRLAAYSEKMAKNDTLYITYSGHGTQFYKDGQTQEGLCFWSGRNIEVLSDKDLLIAINQIHGTVILILDSCYSGGMDREVRKPSEMVARFVAYDPNEMHVWSSTAPRSFKNVVERRINLFACLETEVSWDLGTNGLFTAQFLSAYDAGAKTVSSLMKKTLAGCQPDQHPRWSARGTTGAKKLF